MSRLGPITFAFHHKPTAQQRTALSLINEMNEERRISTIELRVLLFGLLNMPNQEVFPDEMIRLLDFKKAGDSPCSPGRR